MMYQHQMDEMMGKASKGGGLMEKKKKKRDGNSFSAGANPPPKDGLATLAKQKAFNLCGWRTF